MPASTLSAPPLWAPLTARQTVPGDWAVLARAMGWLHISERGLADVEYHLALRTLADWWDKQAHPKKPAAFARLYQWKARQQKFVSLSGEDPGFTVDEVPVDAPFAMFEPPAGTVSGPILAIFFQGSAGFTQDRLAGVGVHYTNGKLAYSVGCDLDQMNEAQYGLVGLRNLAKKIKKP